MDKQWSGPLPLVVSNQDLDGGQPWEATWDRTPAGVRGRWNRTLGRSHRLTFFSVDQGVDQRM